MKSYIAYHNEFKMGFPLSRLAVRTSKEVRGLEGSTVWVIEAVGRRSKRFYLGSKFTVDKCEVDKYPGDELRNEVSGSGQLFGVNLPLNGTVLLDVLKHQLANFARCCCEVRDPTVLSSLNALI